MAVDLLISDLHLAPEQPRTTALLAHFLAHRAPQASRLLILGDLFDAWIGDDDDAPHWRDLRRALRTLTQSGTACLIQRGNRDFLLGRRFCRETGATLLRDPAVLPLGGIPTLLMHGDLLCTDDVHYQRFRRWVRNPVVR